ncbi:hypothetical protein L1987_73061 [Smallanthus sonchifolius]|uniref:Uncharacterized protein n=1 Tax=Smallanthus sonchifolius TaxID=185202 RepID=A0ACB9A168_9ASTR|nr:hypothetical protein L1987_73061 [Smallanthus sonchifolius]
MLRTGSWIGKRRTWATGIGLLLDRAMDWAKTEPKINGWKKGMCKHHLDGKLEGIALTSRLKHHVSKNRDSTGRKRKNEGYGVRNHRCSAQGYGRGLLFVCIGFACRQTRVQPVRSTHFGRGNGNRGANPDGVPGWNPFARKSSGVSHGEHDQRECHLNRSASTIPTVSPSSTRGFSVSSDSASDSLGSCSSSPVCVSLAWSDVVKGLVAGSMVSRVHKVYGGSGLVTPVSSPPLVDCQAADFFSDSVSGEVHVDSPASPVSILVSESTSSAGFVHVPPVTVMSQDVTSGADCVTAGSMAGCPSGPVASIGPFTSGLNSSSPSHVDAGPIPPLTAAGPFIDGFCCSTSPIIMKTDGPFTAGFNPSSAGFPSFGLSAGPSQVINIPSGPIFTCADGLEFNPPGPVPVSTEPFVGPNSSTPGPTSTTDDLLFGSMPSVSNTDLNLVGAKSGLDSIANPDGIKVTSRHLKVFGHSDEVHASKPIVVEPVVLEQPKSVPLVPPVPLAQQAHVVDVDGFVSKKKQAMDGGPQLDHVSTTGPMLDSGPKGMVNDVAPSIGPSVSWGPSDTSEKWTPKHKEYYFHISKEVIKDQGGPSTTVEVAEDADVDSETNESSRFMKLS